MFSSRTVQFSKIITRNTAVSMKFMTTASTKSPIQSDSQSSLARHLAERIKAVGPLTIADYMRESLLHPVHGYYSKKESFIGKDHDKDSTDFVTSPEISSIFGELISLWIIHQMVIQQHDLPVMQKKVNLVELGPGTGTMMSDILRTFIKLGKVSPSTKTNEWHVHMVEASKRLEQVQRSKLMVPDLIREFPQMTWHDHVEEGISSASAGPCVFIAHEFFDALPIHKFQRVNGKGFREILVDIDDDNNADSGQPKFRYVLARGPTPASVVFAAPHDDTRKHIETCPAAIRIVDRIARHLSKKKFGFALFADYGHVGDGGDTFRGYLKSEQKEPLSVEPGSCDLTADVDFSQLVATVEKHSGVRAVGPVTQREFLINMGFLHRLEVLLEICRERKDEEAASRLREQAELLLSKNEMGSRFKFLAIFPKNTNGKASPIAGFSAMKTQK